MSTYNQGTYTHGMRPVIYLRREPSDTSGKPSHRDVIAYASEYDAQVGYPIAARWPWFHGNKPTSANKSISIAGIRYTVVWLDHMGRVHP